MTYRIRHSSGEVIESNIDNAREAELVLEQLVGEGHCEDDLSIEEEDRSNQETDVADLYDQERRTN